MCSTRSEGPWHVGSLAIREHSYKHVSKYLSAGATLPSKIFEQSNVCWGFVIAEGFPLEVAATCGLRCRPANHASLSGGAPVRESTHAVSQS